MPKQNHAAIYLNQRLAKNPRLPEAERHVMAALASEAAKPAWEFFGHDAAIVWRVVGRVVQAFKQALSEVGRPTDKAETDDLQSIIKKAGELQLAIKTSSLPSNWVRHDRFELTAEDMPSVPVDLGWHSLRPGGYGLGYPLAIHDVLGWAAELAQQHLDSLPPRSLERKKGQAKVTAFVRFLAWHFEREFQQEHRTAIGHIASAVFDLADPLDANGVDVRLKDRKAPFDKT